MSDEELLLEIRARVRRRFGFVDEVAKVLQEEIRIYSAEVAAKNEAELYELRRRAAELQYKNLTPADCRPQ